MKRLKLRPRFRSSAKTKCSSDVQEERVASVNIVWSQFQSTSFQRHIKRQQHARLRVQKARAALDQLESSRIRGAVRSVHQIKGPTNSQSDSTPQTYLDHFKASSAQRWPSTEREPRFLCAVYLYGLQRLGTTYITFHSLAQLEQRVRARFAVAAVTSIYREVNDDEFPATSDRRRKHKKRLQRVSTLDQVTDGDTLCVTQNAYDDMSILCEWIKRRQRVVHSFEQVQHAPSVQPTISERSTTPLKQKTGNNVVQPQVWDSNGRRVGLDTQLSILSDDLWENYAQ